jgi:DNA helicase HerA-like ATPase
MSPHTHDTSGSIESIGRIVSVAGAKAIALLDQDAVRERPEMGTLLAIETPRSIVLASVSGLSVPVPSQRDGEAELRIIELNLVGELRRDAGTGAQAFSRGTVSYPALADRVRFATKAELRVAFTTNSDTAVRIGTLRQDASIPAMIDVDDLLGKHFAILGTTGTGKSCTAALVFRAILAKNSAAHVVMIDPHNEYATAFPDMAEIVSPRTLQLPLWLLNFEEITEILVGDPQRKTEIELLAELIPLARARYASGRSHDSARLRRDGHDIARCSVDAPFPYRVSDLLALIEERMGRLENKRDLPPFRQLKSRIEQIIADPRYAFLFGALTVSDDMAQVLGRLFRVPVEDKPLTIIELTGLPTEVVNVVVAVLCRLTFEFALWSEGRVPVTLVCEEAHRYVPANPAVGYAPAKRAIAKIAKEGRKYGASLCIITQRPAEVDPTILSQCNTVFALRMSNDRDQEIVTSAIADTGLRLLEFLPALGQREAIAFGDGVALPARILFDELPHAVMPRSATARFTERWQDHRLDHGFLDAVVERWRTSQSPRPADPEIPDSLERAEPAAEASPPARPNAVVPAAPPPPHDLVVRCGSIDRPGRDPALSASHLTLRERLLRAPRGV